MCGCVGVCVCGCECVCVWVERRVGLLVWGLLAWSGAGPRVASAPVWRVCAPGCWVSGCGGRVGMSLAFFAASGSDITSDLVSAFQAAFDSTFLSYSVFSESNTHSL